MEFIHYMERLHKDIAGSAGDHGNAKDKHEKEKEGLQPRTLKKDKGNGKKNL